MLPDIKENNYNNGGARIAYEVSAHISYAEDVYHKMVVYTIHWIKDKLPSEHHRYYRRKVWEQNDGPCCVSERKLLIHKQRHKKAHQG